MPEDTINPKIGAWVQLGKNRSFNNAIIQQGQRSIGLNRERLSYLICKSFGNDMLQVKPGDFSTSIADVIIAAEAQLIEAKE